jgi:hypothetical protein
MKITRCKEGGTMSQCEKLLRYLQEHGSITGMDSIRLGVMNYKGRICDLRKRGIEIDTTWETHTNADGEKKTYARYVLKE